MCPKYSHLNKLPHILQVPDKLGDKLVSPLGPVIHEVTDLEHDPEEIVMSPFIKSPEERTETNGSPLASETQEIECAPISCLNSPINTSAIEPLSILEPLQPRSVSIF